MSEIESLQTEALAAIAAADAPDALEALRAPLVEWDRAAHGAGYVSD